MFHKSIFNYCASGTIFIGGLMYAFVPLYKLYCQSVGFTGSNIVNKIPASNEKKTTKNIRVIFEANVDKNLDWRFAPLQKHMNVKIGDGSIAFYNAKSISKTETCGIATYNIIPQRAALYFNKIQCFCFEEQILGSDESVDMPVYFYINEEYINDERLKNVDEIVLSYTFFNSNK